jgi:hypothetical protein
MVHRPQSPRPSGQPDRHRNRAPPRRQVDFRPREPLEHIFELFDTAQDYPQVVAGGTGTGCAEGVVAAGEL